MRKDEMPPCPIDEKGEYTDEVPDFKGQYVKVCRPVSSSRVVAHAWSLQDADKVIMKHLKSIGRLIVQTTLTHSYPFCWRWVPINNLTCCVLTRHV